MVAQVRAIDPQFFDRFGTQLEQRFTRDEIRLMMERAGLENIAFREGVPYWCAVGTKRLSK